MSSCLRGGGAMHFGRFFGTRCTGLSYVCNLHEQACAVAAKAYARTTNGLGAALVTTGPGGTKRSQESSLRGSFDAGTFHLRSGQAR